MEEFFQPNTLLNRESETYIFQAILLIFKMSLNQLLIKSLNNFKLNKEVKIKKSWLQFTNQFKLKTTSMFKMFNFLLTNTLINQSFNQLLKRKISLLDSLMEKTMFTMLKTLLDNQSSRTNTEKRLSRNQVMFTTNRILSDHMLTRLTCKSISNNLNQLFLKTRLSLNQPSNLKIHTLFLKIWEFQLKTKD